MTVTQFKITNQPMKILHVSSEPSWRGGEQQLAYLYEELEKKGIQQVILCATNSSMEKYCIERQWNYYTETKKSGIAIRFSGRIKSLCKKLEIDVVHTHDAHSHTFAIIAAVVFGNNTPLVVSRRVDFPVSKSKSSLFKYNHKAVRKIVCVSDKIKEITAKDITDKTKLITIHSGIDLSKFEGTYRKGKLRTELGLTNQTLIGNTSALADHKDYFTFLDTAKLINQSISDSYFVIIGVGPLEAEIKSYAKSLKLENISFTGFRTDIPEILEDLDVFLITSKTEGLGTSILDAFACNVPVVATAAGGIPEIVIDKRSGLLAPIKNAKLLADQVRRLLNEDQLRLDILSGAKKVLNSHAKSITAEKTLLVYQEVLGR